MPTPARFLAQLTVDACNIQLYVRSEACCAHRYELVAIHVFMLEVPSAGKGESAESCKVLTARVGLSPMVSREIPGGFVRCTANRTAGSNSSKDDRTAPPRTTS